MYYFKISTHANGGPRSLSGPDKKNIKKKVKCDVDTENGIIFNYHWGMHTKQRHQQTKWRHLMVNMVFDWNTNLHTIDIKALV